MESDLQRYLHEHIPLSRMMEVTVVKANPTGVQLSAPIAPNINHRDSVFGGSLSALAILSAWSYLHMRLTQESIACRLVIQHNSMHYDEPALGTFEATVDAIADGQWLRFSRTLHRMGKARITLHAALTGHGRHLGSFEGQFVAIRQQS